MSESRTTKLYNSPPPSQPLNLVLSGERARVRRVNAAVGYLDSVGPLRHQPGHTYTWKALLAGEVDEVSAGGIRPRSKLCTARAGVAQARGVLSFGGAIESGVDYKGLATSWPTQRYKFYHSFGDQEASERYLTEVIRQANEQGLSMAMKSFDHSYDGINLYTWHFQELQNIIAGVYESSPDAFMDTEHFLQGQIPGIKPQHIGWVQEPIAGLGHSSHSIRMGSIGSMLDASGLSSASYIEGCEAAGVLPDMPWLLSPGYEAQLLDRATA